MPLLWGNLADLDNRLENNRKNFDKIDTYRNLIALIHYTLQRPKFDDAQDETLKEEPGYFTRKLQSWGVVKAPVTKPAPKLNDYTRKLQLIRYQLENSSVVPADDKRALKQDWTLTNDSTEDARKKANAIILRYLCKNFSNACDQAYQTCAAPEPPAGAGLLHRLALFFREKACNASLSTLRHKLEAKPEEGISHEEYLKNVFTAWSQFCNTPVKAVKYTAIAGFILGLVIMFAAHTELGLGVGAILALTGVFFAIKERYITPRAYEKEFNALGESQFKTAKNSMEEQALSQVMKARMAAKAAGTAEMETEQPKNSGFLGFLFPGRGAQKPASTPAAAAKPMPKSVREAMRESKRITS